jgi:hypothetical protein
MDMWTYPVWLTGALIGALAAQTRSFSLLSGILGGLLLGPLAFLLFFVREGRRCPHCHEVIQPQARACKHCGRALEPWWPPDRPARISTPFLGFLIMLLTTGLVLAGLLGLSRLGWL